jgi:hypothetical protein
MSSTRTLVGYVAQISGNVLCDGDACVVFGSRLKLKSYLASNPQTAALGYAIQKAWSDDILTVLRMGAAYAFDEEAFHLFYPLAQRAGMNLPQADFRTPAPAGLAQPAIHLVRVQWFAASSLVKLGR